MGDNESKGDDSGKVKTLKTMNTIIVLSENDPNLIRCKGKYGKTHKIQAVLGTAPSLERLQDNQSVCWGDGKSYHFRLTKL